MKIIYVIYEKKKTKTIKIICISMNLKKENLYLFSFFLKHNTFNVDKKISFFYFFSFSLYDVVYIPKMYKKKRKFQIFTKPKKKRKKK